MINKFAMNQNTYDGLSSHDKNTYYFIDNSLEDGEIKKVANYLLSDEIEKIRKMLKGDYEAGILSNELDKYKSVVIRQLEEIETLRQENQYLRSLLLLSEDK